jgi:hypothetical protein
MEKRFTRTALYLTGTLLVWAADFLFLYVFAALACARGWSRATVFGMSAIPAASALCTVAALAATAAIVALARRDLTLRECAQSPTRSIALTAAVLAAIAIALTALPGAMVRETCY